MIFYHGTTTAFNLMKGDILLPAIITGNLREDWRKKHIDKVFFTNSLLSAEKFAKKAANKYGGEPPYYHINTNEFIADRAIIIDKKE